MKFVSYEEKVEMVKDAKAGGVETQVDNSVIVLERKDALEGIQKLVFSTPQRPQVLFWDVGEIRFFTPAAGGKEIGPFRVGETFTYEGQGFRSRWARRKKDSATKPHGTRRVSFLGAGRNQFSDGCRQALRLPRNLFPTIPKFFESEGGDR